MGAPHTHDLRRSQTCSSSGSCWQRFRSSCRLPRGWQRGALASASRNYRARSAISSPPSTRFRFKSRSSSAKCVPPTQRDRARPRLLIAPPQLRFGRRSLLTRNPAHYRLCRRQRRVRIRGPTSRRGDLCRYRRLHRKSRPGKIRGRSLRVKPLECLRRPHAPRLPVLSRHRGSISRVFSV